MNLIEFFSDHTFRMVFFGTMTIGFVAGALGSFAYLRKQSMISDVISHSALPGTLAAFLFTVVILQSDGRNMLALIIGAVIVGTSAVLFTHWIVRNSKVHVDSAMAVTLSLFFGAGMLLMRIISDGAFPGKGGIQDYLFGNASTITKSDFYTSLAVGGIALAIVAIFWKEFAARTFDPIHASMMGIRGKVIDTLMFAAIVIASVIGVRAVGLVVMIAFVITPPAAARQWTSRLGTMVMLSALIGAAGSGIGAYLAVTLGKVPTGPMIVIVLFTIFVISLIFSPRRSLVMQIISRRRARTKLKNYLLGRNV
ncbi:metal ABC transporter permease [Arcanobacterium phocae]|uniref:Manganese/zinc/iron transport system permease protein n=1 Tax=Arcanobacterium phocae TaxID=131112 RepID=A0A1H2LBE4_9ACTO|nr:metal ABC transporter permease [Arcanobacterium phocae]SDU78045.1 manganese/zinc/iron transport system permease protein [Arcanobacterium phocae]